MADVLSYMLWILKVRFTALFCTWQGGLRSTSLYYVLILLAVMALYVVPRTRPFFRRLLPAMALVWLVCQVLTALVGTGRLAMDMAAFAALADIGMFAMLLTIGIAAAIPAAWLVFLWRGNHAPPAK